MYERDELYGVQGGSGVDAPAREGDAYGPGDHPQLVLPSPRRLPQGTGNYMSLLRVPLCGPKIWRHVRVHFLVFFFFKLKECLRRNFGSVRFLVVRFLHTNKQKQNCLLWEKVAQMPLLT